MTYISDLDPNPNPDFPFAAVGNSGVVYALFKYEEEADEFLETSSTGASRVVDTRPKPDPKDGEVWVITKGMGSYASKVPFLAFVRDGSFLFGSAYDTPVQESGLDMMNVDALDGSRWAGHRIHTLEGDD